MKITSLSQLSEAQVTQAHATATQLLKERHPEIDLSRGAFDSLVMYVSALFDAANTEEASRLQQSQSLLAVLENPTLADSDIVDSLLSNYNITRKPGARSSGVISVIVEDNITTVVPAQTTFAANGVGFRPTAVITARPAGIPLTSDDERTLEAVGDGRYTFSFPALAVSPGTAANLRRGTTLLPDIVPGNFITAYAGTDFAGGVEEELNSDLLRRQQEGVAAKALSGRTNIAAILREEEAFSGIVAISVIGYGNAEMHRDQHWIFPSSGGGRVDIYVKTAERYQSASSLITATLVDHVADGGIWQFVVSNSDSPAFYEVAQIVPANADASADSGFSVVSDIRSYDTTDTGIVPDIVNAAEAAFTAYQTAVIRFLDTTTTAATAVGTTATYSVTVRAMPLIAELQQYVLQPGIRHLCADTLVKAPIPCFLSISAEILQGSGTPVPDVTKIKTALVTYVNATGFVGHMSAAEVGKIIHGFLTSSQLVRNISLHGRILRPHGDTIFVRSTDVLSIPDDPAGMVTANTVVFFTDVDAISVVVTPGGFAGAV